MKILNIIQCSNLGGMEKSTLESLVVLKNQGHDVKMISLHPVGALKPLAEAKGIPLDGPRRYRLAGLGNIGWLLKTIKQYKPDRIWLTGHNFGSLLAAGVSGIPAYLSIHFHHCERPMWLWRVFYSLANRVCSGIRFNSRYIFREVETLFKGNEKAVFFPNIFRAPVDVVDRVTARRTLGVPEESFSIGNAGWLIPRKAFDVFLQTAALVKIRIPHAIFIIAGDGSERLNLEKMAESLNIKDNVMFIGWQKNLAPFYGALDVLLFNSHFDSLSRTPVEALCYGVPVVASETHGGLDEFIRHGQDGFLINRHDPQALADEIVKLHDQADYRGKCAQSGRERVLEMGSSKLHLEHLIRMMDLA